MFWPSHDKLRIFLLWSIMGVITGLALTFGKSSVWSFLGKIIGVYFFGALWSDFAFISLLSVALVAYVAAVISFRLSNQIDSANFAFTGFVYLSLFTIWIEPWITESGGLMTIIIYAFKLTIFAVLDLGASVFWLLAREVIHENMKSELG